MRKAYGKDMAVANNGKQLIGGVLTANVVCLRFLFVLHTVVGFRGIALCKV